VSVQHSTIVKVEKLMLASPLDALDHGTPERSQAGGRQTSPKRWMKQPHFSDGAADDALAQRAER